MQSKLVFLIAFSCRGFLRDKGERHYFKFWKRGKIFRNYIILFWKRGRADDVSKKKNYHHCTLGHCNFIIEVRKKRALLYIFFSIKQVAFWDSPLFFACLKNCPSSLTTNQGGLKCQFRDFKLGEKKRWTSWKNKKPKITHTHTCVILNYPLVVGYLCHYCMKFFLKKIIVCLPSSSPAVADEGKRRGRHLFPSREGESRIGVNGFPFSCNCPFSRKNISVQILSLAN